VANLKNKQQLAQESETLATSFEYVYYLDRLYAPMDYETEDDSVIPTDDRKCWKPMDHKAVMRKARAQFDTLFDSEAQLQSFYMKVVQASQHPEADDHYSPSSLLVKTSTGLKTLKADGKLHDPDGSFNPNLLSPVLNEDPKIKAEVREVLNNWLGNEPTEVESLLNHLATALNPDWSAGKYVLLIGNGRNGKSVLMKMLASVFGRSNCSGISRQDLSEKSPALFDLNSKLLNIVFDGMAVYLKDSGTEKSIITGEEVGVRKLYSSTLATVRTNALFVEGLNQEPKSKDKSSALQARLVRFWFPNKYPVDSDFEKRMLSEEYLGAFLSLLMDHFVKQDEAAAKLAPTARSFDLQLEHMEENSMAMQFLMHVEETDPLGAEAALLGMEFAELTKLFSSWRLKLNDLSVWDPVAVAQLFRPVLLSERRSKRVAGKSHPSKVRVVTGFTQDALDLLAAQRVEVDDDVMVGD
jgi:hypothetical protein